MLCGSTSGLQRQSVSPVAGLVTGVALAFAGHLDGGGMLGNIFTLASALFCAGVFFLSKEDGVDPLESLILGNSIYLLLVPLCVMDQSVRSTPLSQWPLLLVLGALTGVVAWLCFTVGIKHISALRANFITISEPIMAPIWT